MVFRTSISTTRSRQSVSYKLRKRSWLCCIGACLLSMIGCSTYGPAPEAGRQGAAWDLSHGVLRVSDDQRYLVQEDGTPFLYLSDTNWELVPRSTREDVDRLLDKRRSQGFTVIFAPVLGNLDILLENKPLRVPNAYGDLAFAEADVSRPLTTPGSDPNDEDAYDYWDHIDYIIDAAAERGMVVALIPGWSDYYQQKLINDTNVEDYGRFLGERFRQHDNVVWVLGGDTHPVQSGGLALHNHLAEAIKDADEHRHLMSFHPRGGFSSSRWFRDADWIDFHMIQSGHDQYDVPNYQKIAKDYSLPNYKPTLDGENRYEDHAVKHDPANGWFTDFDNRQAAYWGLLAGGFGHTYGSRGVWQMWQPGREKYKLLNYPWYEGMDLPGAWDMQHVRSLLMSRPMAERVPNQQLLVNNYDGAAHLQAAHGKDYLLVYSPAGEEIVLTLKPWLGEGVSSEQVVAWWFNPRDGHSELIGHFEAEGSLRFHPPGKAQRGNDWVLVVDREGAGFPAPGSRL